MASATALVALVVMTCVITQDAPFIPEEGREFVLSSASEMDEGSQGVSLQIHTSEEREATLLKKAVSANRMVKPAPDVALIEQATDMELSEDISYAKKHVRKRALSQKKAVVDPAKTSLKRGVLRRKKVDKEAALLEEIRQLDDQV